MLLPSFGERLQHAWNAFRNNRDPTYKFQGAGSYYRADRPRLSRGNERSIVSSVCTRIAIDVAQIDLYHARVDDNGNFIEKINSSLNNILTVEANIDQSARAFIIDLVISMLNEGVVACVPIETNIDPRSSTVFDIHTMRTAKIVQWYPKHVKVQIYNEITGNKQELMLPKRSVAIIENPFFSVMNEPNSTLQRLIRKLNMLDILDEQISSGKLDLILSLPYVTKTEAKQQQAEQRRKLIEEQLTGSKYGIAYIDATEKVTQLNRPVENNLMNQVEYLTTQFYSQLGITDEVFKGTADEKTMLNYYNGTIEPICSAIVEEFRRKFLTKTARTQNQSIIFIRRPFKLVSASNLAEIADKFTRNEILSSNEVRSLIGYRPSDDPRADQLVNKNLRMEGEMMEPGMEEEMNPEMEGQGGYELPQELADTPVSEV